MNGHSKQGREIEELNLSLRQRDKVKDDAIAQLSDPLQEYYMNLREDK